MRISRIDGARQSDTASITEDIATLTTANANGHNMTRTHMHNRADEVIADTAAVVAAMPSFATGADVSGVKTDTAAVVAAMPSFATGNQVSNAHSETRNLLADLPLVGVLQNGNIRGDVAEEGAARTTTAAIHLRIMRASLITEVRFAAKAGDTGTRDFRIARVTDFYSNQALPISVYSMAGVANHAGTGVKGVAVNWPLLAGDYMFLMRTNAAQGFGIGGTAIFDGAPFGDFLMYAATGDAFTGAAAFPSPRYVDGDAAPWMPYFGFVFGG